MPDLKFKPVYRLRKTDEFSSVFAFRRTLRSDHFMLHYRPAIGSSARLGVVVAKKLARAAVLRNLVKRLAREQFRHVRETLPPYDVILRANRPLASVPRAELRRQLARLLERLIR